MGIYYVILTLKNTNLHSKCGYKVASGTLCSGWTNGFHYHPIAKEILYPRENIYVYFLFAPFESLTVREWKSLKLLREKKEQQSKLRLKFLLRKPFFWEHWDFTKQDFQDY